MFFSSSAGYYWLEVVDHYATGVNLVVFLFFQLVVLVYFLPIESLVEKVNHFGEKFPNMYLTPLKIVCPAFSLFLAAMAIAKEIKFPAISESIITKIVSYTIFLTPAMLFLVFAIWNPFGDYRKEEPRVRSTEQLLKDSEGEIGDVEDEK